MLLQDTGSEKGYLNPGLDDKMMALWEDSLTLQISKQKMRKAMIQDRRSWSADYRAEAAAQVTALLWADALFRDAPTIMAFAAMKDELATQPLLAQILEAGKRLLLPRCRPKSRIFEPVEVTDLARDLSAGPLPGLFDPNPDLQSWPVAQTLPFVLVPGLAFDACGHRLGYGKGMYDRFLTHYAVTHTVGVAFSKQMVAQVPADDHDVPMQRLLSENGWVHCR